MRQVNGGLGLVIGLGLLGTACSNNGDLGGQTDATGATTTGDFQIEVSDELTFLSRQGSDVRTSYLVRFRLSDANGNPILGLREQDFSVAKDGNPSTSENVKLPTNALAKIDVALCLDNSLSLAVDATGTPTPQNVADLEAAAVIFIDEIVDDAHTLRLYKFSTASRTEQIGEYVSDGLVWTSTGDGPPTTPQEDVRLAIDPGELDTGTALFQAVDLALDDDPELDDFVVVFSDGVEEGSAPGSRAEVLGRIDENEIVVFSVGVGGIESADFAALSRFGRVFVSDAFNGVEQSFEAVANEVQSIYTVLFDTPDQEGEHEIELTIRSGELTGQFRSTFRAGIDLALNSFFAPLSPGSFSTFTECAGLASDGSLTSDCGGQVTFAVADLSESRVNEDGILHFRIETTAGEDFVAPLGDGAIRQLDGEPRRTLMPDRLEIGTTWRETPEAGLERRIVGREDLTLAGIDFVGCFTVEVIDLATSEVIGIESYKQGVGLVRSEDVTEGITTQLLTFPSVSPSFL